MANSALLRYHELKKDKEEYNHFVRKCIRNNAKIATIRKTERVDIS